MSPTRLYIAALCSALILSACGAAEDNSSPQEEEPAEEGWSCSAERDGWERCDGASVIWCHAAEHGDYASAHFHEGTNCGEDALNCVELDEQTAACADPGRSCDAGYAECDDRYALNCVDGVVASMRCSLTEACQVVDAGARCLPIEEEQ